MLNPTKLKTYATAYNIRLKRGESLESIDKLYLDMKRLDKDEIEQIHKSINLVKYIDMNVISN